MLQQHCKDVGRDEDEIIKSWSPECIVRATEAEAKAVHEARRVTQPWLEEWDAFKAGNLAGSAEQVSDRINEYINMGCTYFVPWFPDYPGTETLERLAGDVMPAFR